MVSQSSLKTQGGRARMCVLVPTYQRTEDLARCLRALAMQTRAADQILIVCRDTDSETQSFLRSFGSGEVSPTIVKVKAAGQVAALNAGLKEVDADIVAITDDDAAPHADWLARIEEHFASDAKIGAVGGRDHVQGHGILGPDKLRVGEMQWFGRMVGNHHRGYGPERSVDFIKGANMSYRMVAVGDNRFDDRLRGTGAQVHNDLAFSLSLKRKGWILLYDPAVAVDHFPAQRFDEDQRDEVTARTIEDRAYNETLTILEHLPRIQRFAFWVWALLIGTRQLPGILHCVRLPATKPPAWKRLMPVSRGRFAAARAARHVSRRAERTHVVSS